MDTEMVTSVTIKELCDRLKIKPSLARALLAEGILPGSKLKGVWHLRDKDYSRIEQAFQQLRGISLAPPDVAEPITMGCCPNCHQPSFGASEGRGWGEFYECAKCKFSIHEHNLDSPALVANAIREHRKRSTD